MFGYVCVNKQELKGKELDRYQAYYCGLCRSLKEQHGILGQLTLSYDTVFLVILLTGLYEPENREFDSHCILHPFVKRKCINNEYARYAADMNVMLSYFKCLDDWEDEHKVIKYILSVLLKGKNQRIQTQYEHKAQVIYDNLKAIQECEHAFDEFSNIDSEVAKKREWLKNRKKEETQSGYENSQNIDLSNGRLEEETKDIYRMDTVAGYFGRIMEEICAYRQDEWEQTLRRAGFFLGKYIYLMDAYEDMEKDSKTGNYNPVLKMYQSQYANAKGQIRYVEEFEDQIKGILRMMMAECSKAFERLPIIEEAEILRNILYSGVWSRYEMVRSKRFQATIKIEEKGSRQE